MVDHMKGLGLVKGQQVKANPNRVQLLGEGWGLNL